MRGLRANGSFLLKHKVPQLIECTRCISGNRISCHVSRTCKRIQHAHRVVPKDELLSAVWQGDVVTAGALTQCVFQARKAIGDTGTKQRMIATVNKRGYRFIADVQVSCPGAPRQRAG